MNSSWIPRDALSRTRSFRLTSFFTAGAAVGFVLCPRYSMGDWLNPLVRLVVNGNKADEYSKVIAKWGTFYFKNGQSISEQIWSVNTEQ